MRNLSTAICEDADAVLNQLQNVLCRKDTPYHKLFNAMAYASLDGGKRIRPFITLEFSTMYGGNHEAAVIFGTALEMIHTYSLIHDDLPCMDNDDIRRGKPSLHRAFDESTALLAGDALLTEAFGLVADCPLIDDAGKVRAISVLSRGAGSDGMIAGQVLDLLGASVLCDREVFLQMNRLKTGCLIHAAAELGCIASGIEQGEKRYMDSIRYADAIGLAFQIQDDILDIGTEDDKVTFLSFMSVEEAKAKAASLTCEAKSQIAEYTGHEVLSAFADFLLSRRY